MTWYRAVPAAVIVSLQLVPGAAPAADELSAVATQVAGTVTVTAGPEGKEVRRLEPFGLVRTGDEINVPAGGRVGLACSSDRWIELTGPELRTLTPAACADGRPLEPGSYRSMAPRGGRFRTIEGVMVLERGTREPAVDVMVLSPRETAVLAARPLLRWRREPGAIEYQIEITGLGNRQTIGAAQVRCRPEAAWDGLTVCSLPLPESYSDLAPGKTASLNVGYRTSIAAPFVTVEEGVSIKRLDDGKKVRERLAAIGALPVAELIRALLAAGVYAEHRLYADAIAAYRRAATLLPSAPVEVTLGDLYLEVGLLRFAARHYQAALDTNAGPAVEAAAAFGFGRAHYGVHNYGEARERFQQAAALYSELGLAEEQAAAEKWALAAEQRRPH